MWSRGLPSSALRNYIYNLQGSNCMGPGSAAAPPDIIIDSGTLKPPRKPGPPKKTPAKKKK